MYIVTGGAGFIGSQIVKALVKSGKKVVVVDDLSCGKKFENLLGLDIEDYLDKDVFLRVLVEEMADGPAEPIEAIIHNGAISSTTNWNGKEVMSANYDFSKIVLEFCTRWGIHLIYASSASVYGVNKSSIEDPFNEKPLNVYGYSKLLFDNYVRKNSINKVCGLRYFNVYGPGEQFKGSQASPFFRYYKELRNGEMLTVFSGDDGFGGKAENTKRDFIYVDDIVRVVLWALKNKIVGIFNVGTGKAHKFDEVADLVIGWCLKKKHIQAKYLVVVGYPMGEPEEAEKIWRCTECLPQKLQGRSQPYTCANLVNLRQAGYKKKFISIEDGCKRYMKWLDENYSRAWG